MLLLDTYASIKQDAYYRRLFPNGSPKFPPRLVKSSSSSTIRAVTSRSVSEESGGEEDAVESVVVMGDILDPVTYE